MTPQFSIPVVSTLLSEFDKFALIPSSLFASERARCFCVTFGLRIDRLLSVNGDACGFRGTTTSEAKGRT